MTEDGMNDLLESTAVSVLPASLWTLRLQQLPGCPGVLEHVPR